MENGQKSFTYGGTLGLVNITENDKADFLDTFLSHLKHLEGNNSRENAELPPLLTVLCHHGKSS